MTARQVEVNQKADSPGIGRRLKWARVRYLPASGEKLFGDKALGELETEALDSDDDEGLD